MYNTPTSTEPCSIKRQDASETDTIKLDSNMDKATKSLRCVGKGIFGSYRVYNMPTSTESCSIKRQDARETDAIKIG